MSVRLTRNGAGVGRVPKKAAFGAPKWLIKIKAQEFLAEIFGSLPGFAVKSRKMSRKSAESRLSSASLACHKTVLTGGHVPPISLFIDGGAAAT